MGLIGTSSVERVGLICVCSIYKGFLIHICVYLQCLYCTNDVLAQQQCSHLYDIRHRVCGI
jgi:hypothetical protein